MVNFPKIRSIKQIMEEDGVDNAKAGVIRKTEEWQSMAANILDVEEREEMKFLDKISEKPSSRPKNKEKTFPPPEQPKMPEKQKPILVDAKTGRILKGSNYKLNKEPNASAGINYGSRTGADQIFNRNDYKPLGINEVPSGPPKTPPLQRDHRGRFFKKNNEVSEATISAHVGVDENVMGMAQTAFGGFTRKVIGSDDFPQQHTVPENEERKKQRLRGEQLARWLSGGLISKQHGDTSYPETDFVHEKLSRQTAQRNDVKPTQNNGINSKISDLAQIKSRNENSQIVLLREISNTLKQIQKSGGISSKKAGYFTSWRKEQEKDRKRDNDFMSNEGGKNRGDHLSNGMGGVLTDIAGLGIAKAGIKAGRSGLSTIGKLMGVGTQAIVGEAATGGAVSAVGFIVGIAALIAGVTALVKLASDNFKKNGDSYTKNKNEEIKSAETAKKMPTNIPNIFKSGEANLEQFNKLKNDAEKRKYLQGYGVDDKEIDEILKNPEKLKEYDDEGKKQEPLFTSNVKPTQIDPAGGDIPQQQNPQYQLPLGGTSGGPTATPYTGAPNTGWSNQGVTGGMRNGERTATPSPDIGANPSPVNPTKMNMTQKEYYNSTYKEIYDAAVKKGLPNPEVVAKIGAAQSSIETGYGQHVVGNNYFGIKSGGGVGKGGVSAGTTEVVNGRVVHTNANFASFGSKAESAEGYVDFLTKNPRYKGVISAKTNDEALDALGKSGYATDPKYRTKVASVIEGNKTPSVDPKMEEKGVALAQRKDQADQMQAQVAAKQEQKSSPTIIAPATTGVSPQGNGNNPPSNTTLQTRQDDPVFLKAQMMDWKTA